MSQTTFKSFVVECTEDYNLLYREIRQKQKIPINIIVVPNGKLDPVRRVYSDQKLSVLKREHGFIEYLDETCTAPDPIMQALISKHNIDKVLVGGNEVEQSLARKGLENYICSKENGRGYMSACFFFTRQNASPVRHTINVSKYSGKPGTDKSDVGPARLLQTGMDPREKDQLTQTISDSNATIERLTPEMDNLRSEQERLFAQGQPISLRIKEAKDTKTDYTNFKSKLRNQKRKVADAEELASMDNSTEKARVLQEIYNLFNASTKAKVDAEKTNSEMMKAVVLLTGVKMSEHSFSEDLQKVT